MDNEGSYWVRWIINEVCGLTHSSKLTMRILESHLAEILSDLGEMRERTDKADDRYATIAIGYQVLALFLLETGAYVPEVVKEEVLFSTTWEYDQRWWGRSDFIESRKKFLNKLREAVKNQIQGKKYKF